MGFRIDAGTVAKTVSAFLAGLVLVLGGALIYSRAQVPVHPLEVAPPAPIAPPPQVEDQNVPEEAPEQVAPPVAPPAAHAVPKIHALPRPRQKPYQMARVRISTPLPVTRVLSSAGLRMTASTTASESGATVQAPTPTPDNPPPSQPKYEPPAPPAREPQRETQAQVQTTPQQSTPAPVASALQVAQIPQPPQPHVVTLPSGTSFVVRLRETLSSDRNSTGDTFRGTLDLPIIANGFIIADRGSLILGRVVFAEKARLMGGSADLILSLSEINTTDGQLVRVDTSPWEQRGPDLKVRNAPKALFGAAVGAVEGALNGASQGAGLGQAFGEGPEISTSKQRTLVLPIDTRIPFRLAHPLTITEKLK